MGQSSIGYKTGEKEMDFYNIKHDLISTLLSRLIKTPQPDAYCKMSVILQYNCFRNY